MVTEYKHRVHWIDVSKGILILLMLTGHVPNIVSRIGNDLGVFKYWFLFIEFYGCFFMQTFFILTGYTSNFDVDFKSFIIKLVKSILVPYVFFCCITKFIGVLYLGEKLYENVHGQQIFFLVEGFWFLSAIFIAKILYYLIRKSSNNNILRCVFCIVLMLIGFYITLLYKDMPDPSHFNNYFHYRNALCMTFFIWFGEFMRLKITSKVLSISSIMFIIMYIVTKKCDLKILEPIGYSHTVTIYSIWQVFSYIFYCIAGSFFVIRVSKCIGKNPLLEFFGKNSIVIYCSHFTFIYIYAKLFHNLYGISLIFDSLYFLLVVISTIISVVLVSLLFKYKPFTYIIGKY